MCRSIKPLFNLAPSATEAEIQAAALQYVRKVSGSRKPSQANAAAFEQAVQEVAQATQQLLTALTTNAAPRSREAISAKTRTR